MNVTEHLQRTLSVLVLDMLQRAETIGGLSHDILVHIRMKRNVFVLNSRRLQRLASSHAPQNTHTSSLPDKLW